MNPFFYFFSLYLLSLGIIWITGGTIMVPFMQNKNHKSLKYHFFRMLSGVLTLTLISSLYFTGGKTIFWLFGIIPLIMLLQNKGYFSLSVARNISYWVPNCYFLLLIPVPFLIQYLNFGPINSFIPFDIIDYVTYSEFNARYEKENVYGVLNSFSSINLAGSSPHHHAEMWLNQLLSNIYRVNPGKNLIHVTYSILFLTTLSGFIGLFENKKIKRTWGILIAITLFFGGPIYWYGITEWFGNIKYLGGSFIIFENYGFFGNTILSAHHAQKHLYFAALFIGVMSLNKNKLLSLSIISILPVVNIGLTLGVFSFGVAYLLVKIVKKSFDWQEIFVLAIPSTLMIVFYAISGMVPSDVSYPPILYKGSEDITMKGEIIRATMRVTNAMLFIVLIYVPLLVTFIVSRKGVNNSGINLPTFFATTSLIVPLLSRPILVGFDSAQFLTYMLPAFTIVLAFSGLEIIMNNKNVTKRIFTAGVILALVSSNAYYIIENNRSKNKLLTDVYSEDYLQKVKLALSDSPQVKLIGYMLSEDLLNSHMPSNWKNQLVGSLAAENNQWDIISLNYPNRTFNFNSWNNESHYNHQQYFWKSDSESNFHDKHLPNFIMENLVHHVFIGTGVSLEWIKVLETEEIIDTKSGERLVVIKGKKNAS